MFHINQLVDKTYKKILENVSWMVLLQLMNAVIPLCIIPYVTRTLGPSGYGIFVIAFNIISYANVLVEYGFRYSGTKKVVSIMEDSKKLDYLFSRILLSRVLLLVVSFFFIIGFYYCFLGDKLGCITSILILFILVLGTTIQQNYIFQGLQQMKQLVFCNIIGRICFVVCTFFFVKGFADLNKYCFFYALGFLLPNLFSFFILRKKYNIHLIRPRFKSVLLELKDGWILFTTAAMTTLTSSISVTILAYNLPSEDVGVYDAMNKIVQIVVLLYTPIMQAVYPFFCKKFNRSFVEGYFAVKKIGKLVIIFFVFILIAIYLLRKPIITIIFGENYLKYNMLIVPLGINFILGAIDNFLGIQILVATMNEALYAKAFYIYSIFSIIVTILLTKTFYAWGAAIANPIAAFVFTIILFFMVNRVKRKEMYEE